MKTNEVFRHYTKLKILSKIFLCSILVCLLIYSPILSEEQGKEIFTINLKSREFTPEIGIKSEILSKLQTMITIEKKIPHVMIQFTRLPSPLDKEWLNSKGIKLLNYIGSNTWYASISDAEALLFTDPEEIKKEPVLGSIRWMGEITPEDKISPLIRKNRIGEWARTPDGKVSLVVNYFNDVDTGYVKSKLEALGAVVLGGVPVVSNLTITIEEQKIADIAAEDFILWIETVPRLGGPESNRIRAHVQADLAQNPPLNLTGDGVIVGVLENSHAYINHPDLSTRAFKGDTDVNNYFSHATNMAGIIAGNGSQNNLYRGMATVAKIYTYDFEPGTATGTATDNNLNYSGDLQTAIGTHHIDIANNSWGTYGCYDFIDLDHLDYGNYNGICPMLDAAVRGDMGKPVIIVFSAGNERDGYYDGTSTDNTSCITNTTAPFENYSTMNHPKASKNIITVGAIDSYNNRMSTYSSWGPVDDGRIKPDIVASGHHNGTLNSNVTEPTLPSHMYLAPYYPTSGPSGGMYGYTGMTAAAAATSGCLALLLEHFRNTVKTDIDPLPSTLKALLIHSAKDLDDNTVSWYNPGPDYASGYGLLQINDAIDLIGTAQVLEGKVNTGESDYYSITVPAGATSVKITLSWDDPQATSNAAIALVNDLDLKIYDTNNVQHYPWTLDPDNPSNDAGTSADHLNNVEQVFVDGTILSGEWEIVVEAHAVPEPPQRYSIVASYPLVGEIDVIQVLDRSGSMGGSASLTMPDTKIQVLRSAASQIIDIMKADIGNRLGLVQFNQEVVSFPAGSSDALSELTSTRALTLKTVAVPSIVDGGSTSIGDGLREALTQFTTPPLFPDHNRSIILVTDGKENTSEYISTVQPDLISNNVTVYSLGLGYGSGINETKLTDLAAATAGTYRISADHLVFQKLFIEALAGAVNWSMITDPIDEITNDETVIVPVTICSDEDGATFTAYWEGLDDAVDLKLIPPSGPGRMITPSTSNRGIRYGEHPRYNYYQLDFPLGGDLSGEWAGEWKMEMTGTDRIDQPQKVRFSTSALAEGGVKFEVNFNNLFYTAGDTVIIIGKLTRSGHPFAGADIDVYCDVPIVGAGNILYDNKVPIDELKKFKEINKDPISLIDSKLKILNMRAEKDVLLRGETQFKLYDDGRHGDGKENDGIYAFSFIPTTIPGSYTFRFVASNILCGAGITTTREWTKSFYSGVVAQPDYSVIDIRAIEFTPDGYRYGINVVPRDPLKNYLGPGHEVIVNVIQYGSYKSNPQILLKDNIDGTYTNEIFVTQEQLKAGVKLDIELDGNKFTTIDKLPTLRK
ncbi:S8 family serine peptidase [bacterium]|nr:S8 family serine peptidase [bacterium]